ncbi:DUF3304 domain-containing protein [Pseudomonas sp. TH03]|nr:DUF3304 domain-containing protein [Pseudomonas sp. TH03]
MFLLVGAVSLSACQAGQEIVSAPVEGYNHTSANINSFTINGAGGPNIGPYEGGGKQVCCSALPAKWNPGLKAVIEWETDPNANSKNNLPPLGTDEFRTAYKKYASNYVQHREIVDIPRYAEKVCSLKVHFLPCDQVRVSTTCFTPSHPNYPDKAYFQMKEPAVCPSH